MDPVRKSRGLGERDLVSPDLDLRNKLVYAAADGDVDLVTQLLEEADGDDVGSGGDTGRPAWDYANGMGRTPLFCACSGGHVDVVRCLLAKGADVDIMVNGDTGTALLEACRKNHVEVVSVLVAAGADTNKADGRGGTPLYEAALHGRVELTSLLLGAGANVNQADAWENTPLIAASATEGGAECVRLLLKAGADPRRWDTRGCMPLHLACRGGHMETVKLLLDEGTDMCLQPEGILHTLPAEFAERFGHEQVASIVVDARAASVAQFVRRCDGLVNVEADREGRRDDNPGGCTAEELARAAILARLPLPAFSSVVDMVYC